jgi:hypothetical protein
MTNPINQEHEEVLNFAHSLPSGLTKENIYVRIHERAKSAASADQAAGVVPAEPEQPIDEYKRGWEDGMKEATELLSEIEEPFAWTRRNMITDDQGYAIGRDDPEFEVGAEQPESDGGEGWSPLYFHASPAVQQPAEQAAPVAESQRIAELEAELAALRDTNAKLSSGLDVAAAWLWRDGPPPHPWKLEWFIARTIHGERVVLRALEEDHSYDYTTADGTYMKERNITKWAQFPDSEYIAPRAPAAPVPAASEGPLLLEAATALESSAALDEQNDADPFSIEYARDLAKRLRRAAAPATSDKAEGK